MMTIIIINNNDNNSQLQLIKAAINLGPAEKPFLKVYIDLNTYN